MNLAAALRAGAAVAVLPLGERWGRALLALGAAVFLGLGVPGEPWEFGPSLVAEAALGASLGFLAGIPAWAGEALSGAQGPANFGLWGRLWAWALFFSVGGPVLLLTSLATSVEAVTPGRWDGLAALTAAGGQLFYAALVLGLPVWIARLGVFPLAAWMERLGAPGDDLRRLAPLLALLLTAALLPTLLQELAALWLEALQ